MYRQTATIKGRGDFPIDMLRHDRACPYSETDSDIIRDSLARGDGHPWEVTIARFVPRKDQKWSVNRWQSFATDITPRVVNKI